MGSASTRVHDHEPAPLPPVLYEKEPGAASLPLPPAYRPRASQATVLYAVVRDNLGTGSS